MSTHDQNLSAQMDALAASGVAAERTVTEHASGAAERPRLRELLDRLAPSSVLVVWRFDRLARSSLELAQIAEHLQSRGVQLRSLSEGVDTDTPHGRLVYATLAAVAELERHLIAERARAGIAAARARGVKFGPKFRLGPIEVRALRGLVADGLGPAELARKFNVSRNTIYRVMAREGIERPE